MQRMYYVPSTNSHKYKQTITNDKLPEKKWHEVSVDHVDPFPDGKHVLVMIDDYSRFPTVEVVKSTSTQKTIQQFDMYFCRCLISV